MRKSAPLLALLLAACPQTAGQQCPAQTTLVGQYSLAFTAHHGTGECISIAPDGGDGGALGVDNAPAQGASLCVGSAGDGGPLLWLAVTGKQPRSSDVSADGGFHFPSHSDPTTGTICTCLIGIDEAFDGFLQTGAAFQLQSDGGLPPVTGLTATLSDQLTTPGGVCAASPDAGTCNTPCAVTYTIVGTRF